MRVAATAPEAPAEDSGAPIEWRASGPRGAEAVRCYLNGRPLAGGADLELSLGDGAWLPGRLSRDAYGCWNFGFKVAPAAADAPPIYATAEIPQQACWRWPADAPEAA